MRKRIDRLLTEDRIVRALRRGGMARLSPQGGWRIFRSTDARGRPIGRALDHVVERLVMAGDVKQVSQAGRLERLVWAKQRRQPSRIIVPPPVVQPAAVRRKPQSLLAKALSLCETRSARIRLAAAAGRYSADIEQAATPQSVTMRWDAAPVQGGRADGGAFGPGGRAMAASARLESVQRVVGSDQMRILDEVLVRSVSAAGLGRLLGRDSGEAVEAAFAALTALAEAYDLSVRSV